MKAITLSAHTSRSSLQSAVSKKLVEGKGVQRASLSAGTCPIATAQTVEEAESASSSASTGLAAPGEALARAVGKEIKSLRLGLSMAAKQLADAAGLSNGMLSKIESGSTKPSFGTLIAISNALNVPVARLFASHEQRADYSLVRAAEGISVQRRGSRVGLDYELLGHLLSGGMYVEPHLVTLSSESSEASGLQHTGMEFMYMLEGAMIYRYADGLIELYHGDTLVLDANSIHGHERLLKAPVRYLSVVFHLGAR
ncbi:helix-turn-helix transcriptional regulator [Bradyrhizobium sp. BRP14]|nr:helix-turn-helix transcriptional regulator [Bradyrhizobium sp. BRP14]